MEIGKFLRIWKKTIALVFEMSMAYRAGFFILLISLFLGDLIIPIVSVIIYSVSQGIPGWNLAEFVLFQGTLILVMGMWHTLFADLLGQTISLVEEGTFDKVLLRPFSSLGFLTANSFELDGIAEVVAGLAIVTWALIQLNMFNFMLIPYFAIVILAVLFEYSLTIIASSLAFVFTKTWRLFELISSVERFSRYPLDVYSVTIKFFITFIIPAAIAAYYPASILLGKQPLITVAWVAIPVIIFFIFSLFLWSIFLKKYTSAGG